MQNNANKLYIDELLPAIKRNAYNAFNFSQEKLNTQYHIISVLNYQSILQLIQSLIQSIQ